MTFYEASAAARRRIRGGVAVVATAQRTARLMSADPFAVAHTAGWPAAAPAF
jgi:hypothetical protein